MGKFDKQVFFVSQALNQGLTQDVKLAAIWFCDNKAWQFETAVALEKFKNWFPKE